MFRGTWLDSFQHSNSLDFFRNSFTKVTLAEKLWVRIVKRHKIFIDRGRQKTSEVSWPLEWHCWKKIILRALYFLHHQITDNELQSTFTQYNFKVACVHGSMKRSDRKLYLMHFVENQMTFRCNGCGRYRARFDWHQLPDHVWLHQNFSRL